MERGGGEIKDRVGFEFLKLSLTSCQKQGGGWEESTATLWATGHETDR